MKILMVSLDKTLLGANGGGLPAQAGDAQERHRRYGEFVEKLDVIVFSRSGFQKNAISEKVTAFPTNSFFKFNYIFDAYKIGKALFRQNNYDLIDTQDPFFTGLVGYWLKKKFSAQGGSATGGKKPSLEIHFHGDFWGNAFQSEAGIFQLLLSKFIARYADGIRVVSQGIKEKLVNRGIPSEKIVVIPTPVDLEKFKAFEPEKVKQIKDDYFNKKIILYAGRLVKVKNLPLLLKAVARIRNSKHNIVLLIIGEGGERAKLKRMVRRLEIEDVVVFISFAPQKDLVNYYHAADVFVLSSFSESLGKVLIEAGAAGCPVVSTETTGARDIVVDGRTGYLAPIGDENAMVEKILKVLRMEESERKEMAENVRRVLEEKFSQEKSIEKVVTFWNKLTKHDAK